MTPRRDGSMYLHLFVAARPVGVLCRVKIAIDKTVML